VNRLGEKEKRERRREGIEREDKKINKREEEREEREKTKTECAAGDAQEGERLGPYRILKPIGEGAWARCNLAHRDDDEFRQRVAIKIVRIPGSLALSRFRHERQILATLEHPNIARLLDGGTTAARRALYRDGVCGGQAQSRSIARLWM